MPTGPNRLNTPQRCVIRIDEVDIANRAVHGYDKTNVLVVASFRESPAGVLAVPAQSERWLCQREGMGQWRLISRLDSADEQAWIETNLHPGDTSITGGTVYVNHEPYQPSGLNWAMAATPSPHSIPGGVGVKTYVSLPSFASNNVSVFDTGTDSFGGGVSTIMFLSAGIYKVHVVAQLFGPPVNNKVTLYYDPPLIQSKFQYPNPDFVPVSGVQDDVGFWEILYGNTPDNGIVFPVGGGVWIETSTTGSFTASVAMYVEQINSTSFGLP